MPFLSAVVSDGILSARPAAGHAGYVYFATDTKQTFRDNGTSWDDVSDAGAVTSVAGRTGAVTLSAVDVSGLAASATTDTTNANNIGSGTLGAARLPVFVGDTGSGGTKGAVPAPAAGDAAAGKFLKADGTFAVPPGSASGTVTSVALSLPSWLSVSGSPVTTSGTLGVTAATGQTQNLFLATPNGSPGAVGLRAIVQADLPAQPVDIPFSFVGKPGAGATTLLFAVTRSLTIPANFSGAVGLIDPVNGANPTATAIFTIKKVSSGTLTTLGTASISTSGVYTFATTGGSAQSLAAGDGVIGIAPSSQDATLSGPYFTIPVTR